MSNFKIAITTIFGAFILIGVIVFALSRNTAGQGSANLLIWGTLSKESFDTLVKNSSLDKSESIRVNYVKKEEDNFDQEFVEALAEGKGPDIVILREDSIYKHRNKLVTIPYKTYSERLFKDTFIEEGELFLTPEGVLAFPLAVDPLVMYWNRDIFSNNNIPQPPKYWDEIYPIVEKVTKKDANSNIFQSALPFGEWRNVSNSKEIISMIFLQAGNPITERNSQGVSSTLGSQLQFDVAPALSALNFYTQFSNPTSNYYTWNRSLQTSLNMFLSGKLAMYFGLSSEIFGIQQKNPNLNFDVARVPQQRDTEKKVVFGHMYAFTITKQSKQVAGAFAAINAMLLPQPLKSFESDTNLPPVRRDMLATKPSDAFRSVFYDSALISNSWIDPNPIESSVTFRDMIESITSGRRKVVEAYVRANEELNSQLK